MKKGVGVVGGNRRGFTLIELLVVAIIAMPISILLPSLSRARSQARATLCASRLSQLTKAMMIYASDDDETPPFISVGYKPCGEDRSYDQLGSPGQNTELYFAQFEQRLIPNLAGAGDEELWLDLDWNQWIGTPKEAKVQKGTRDRVPVSPLQSDRVPERITPRLARSLPDHGKLTTSWIPWSRLRCQPLRSTHWAAVGATHNPGCIRGTFYLVGSPCSTLDRV